MRFLWSGLLTTAAILCGTAAFPGDSTGIAQVELRPGWRMPDGSHMAALHIVLEPGWKTYWRAPGDVGIPPALDWSRSDNIASVTTRWPTPDVFFEQGMRSIGYMSEVVIPMQITARRSEAPLKLTGQMQIGICKDICIPASLSFDADLTADVTRPDPMIAAALTDRPYTAAEAGVRSVSCQFEVAEDGGLVLHTRIDMPTAGGVEHVVVEAGNPMIWVAEPDSRRDGAVLKSSTRMVHVDGRSFILDRSALRFTVIGATRAVDISGCTP